MPDFTFVKSAPSAQDLPEGEAPFVACVGRSNVGKSSFINALAGKKDLCRVSSTPGRTQMLNVFNAGTFFLIDLPGYGFAQASQSKRRELGALIQDFFTVAPRIALICMIVDARLGLTDLDRDMRDQLDELEIPYLVVANKCDKLSRTERRVAEEKVDADIRNAPIVFHSTVTGEGRGEVVHEIQEALRRYKKG